MEHPDIEDNRVKTSFMHEWPVCCDLLLHWLVS